MENKMMHWTQKSISDFIYNISATFVFQLESQMEKEGVSRRELAGRLNKTSGRVSQVFNNPGNLSLRILVEYARALKMKVGIIAYEDGDPNNDDGPINPDVFVRSWQKLDCPTDLSEVEAAYSTGCLDKLLWDQISASSVPNRQMPPPQVSSQVLAFNGPTIYGKPQEVA